MPETKTSENRPRPNMRLHAESTNMLDAACNDSSCLKTEASPGLFNIVLIQNKLIIVMADAAHRLVAAVILNQT